MTVKKTAKLTDDCSRMRTFVDSRLTRSNVSEPWWMVVAASPAVFKTVCGVGESNPLPASEERSVRHLRMWARGEMLLITATYRQHISRARVPIMCSRRRCYRQCCYREQAL